MSLSPRSPSCKLLVVLCVLLTLVACFTNACEVTVNKNNLLGYDIEDGSKIYERTCAGSCPGSSICTASDFRRKTVTRQRGSGQQIRVTVVRACSCSSPSGAGSCSVNGQTFTNGATVYNSCGDRCVCRNGQVTRCCRQRKSFTAMPAEERARFLKGIVDLRLGTGGANPSLQQRYIQFVDDHRRNFNSGIHGIDQLLPWHRWYLLQIENLLRQIDCRITIPFWKWENDYSDPWGSRIWASSSDGLGGGSGGGCVTNGPFRPPFYLVPSAGSNQCLRRHRQGSIPSASQVANLLGTSPNSFTSFHNLISSMHAGVHCAIGGTMCFDHSANAPEFVLHHGNMDRLWATWQSRGSAYQNAYTGAINNFMSGLASQVRPRDVMDISDHLGVCVQYVDSSSSQLLQALTAVPAEILNTVPQARPQWIKSARKFWRSMKMTKAQMNAMLASVDASLGTAPNLPPDVVANDTFALEFGISRAGLEAALNGWQAVSNSDEQVEIEKTKQLLSDLDDLLAQKSFDLHQHQLPADATPPHDIEFNDQDGSGIEA